MSTTVYVVIGLVVFVIGAVVYVTRGKKNGNTSGGGGTGSGERFNGDSYQ